MLKTVAAGVTALFIAASPLAFAEEPSAGASERLTAADWEALTEARIKIVKAALQLTPEQEKDRPAVENAIRVRAMDRQGLGGHLFPSYGAAACSTQLLMQRSIAAALVRCSGVITALSVSQFKALSES